MPMLFPFNQREIKIVWEHCNLLVSLIWLEYMFQFHIFYTAPTDIIIKWPVPSFLGLKDDFFNWAITSRKKK